MRSSSLHMFTRVIALSLALFLPVVGAAEERKILASDVESTTKTSLLKLKPRKTSTVTVAALSKADIELNAIVTFYDEKGRAVSRSKGRVSPRSSLIVEFPHDKLNRYDAAQLRAEVTVEGRGDEPAPFSCPIGVSVDNDDGFVLTSVTQPCSCGVTSGGHVFLDCQTPIGDLSSGN